MKLHILQYQIVSGFDMKPKCVQYPNKIVCRLDMEDKVSRCRKRTNYLSDYPSHLITSAATIEICRVIARKLERLRLYKRIPTKTNYD